jgi:hypothetical protein
MNFDTNYDIRLKQAKQQMQLDDCIKMNEETLALSKDTAKMLVE